MATFHEECWTRIREPVTGRTVLGFEEEAIEFSRKTELTGEGNHMAEFESDLQARYVLKVAVEPLHNR